MNYVTITPELTTPSELTRIVEPLANYICATERPRAALMSALTVLFREVAQTHAAARTHLNAFAENQSP